MKDLVVVQGARVLVSTDGSNEVHIDVGGGHCIPVAGADKATLDNLKESVSQLSKEMGKQVVIEASFQDGQMTYSLKNMTYDELYSRIMADSLLGVCLRRLPPAGLGTNDVSIDWNLRVALENGSNTQTINISSSLDNIYILPDGSITTETPNAE